MKRFFILFCAVVVASMLAMPVFAASSVSVSLSANDKTVNSGDKVTITVSAMVDTCGSGGIEISFDSTVFELSSGDWTLSSALMTDFSKGSKDGVFAFDSASKISGKVFKFTLKVKSNAPIGKSNVTVKFKADSKSASKSVAITIACDHTYSDKCDTSCNKCGATRKVTHSWDSGTAVKQADCKTTGSAKYTCKVCGTTKTEALPKTAHAYDHTCDTTCNTCGQKREITHTFAWSCDATAHWQACTVCGEQQEKSAHTLATVASANEAGHGFACSVCQLIPEAEAHAFTSSCDADCETCGFIRAVTHVYTAHYAYDKDGHWLVCILCGEIPEKIPHLPDESATDTADQICTQCGYIITPAADHTHTVASEWLHNASGHWFQCRCGAFSDSVLHTWDEGTVDEESGIVTYTCTVCNENRAEIYVPETELTVDAEEPQQPMYKNIPLWMLLAGGLGVSLVLNLIFLVSVVVLRRRSKRNGWM